MVCTRYSVLCVVDIIIPYGNASNLKMFQLSGIKVFLLLLVAVSLGAVWYLDTNYYHWGQTIYEHENQLVKNEPVSMAIKKNSTKDFVPTNEWQPLEKGIK